VKIQTIEISGPWQRAVSRWLALCGTSCRMHTQVSVCVCVCVNIYICGRKEPVYISTLKLKTQGSSETSTQNHKTT